MQEVYLVNLHMRMHQQEGRTKLKKLVGEKMYKELELLHQADSTAKYEVKSEDYVCKQFR